MDSRLKTWSSRPHGSSVCAHLWRWQLDLAGYLIPACQSHWHLGLRLKTVCLLAEPADKPGLWRENTEDTFAQSVLLAF